ncbi:DHH family phosphoesterase, partial [Anaerosalibacter bizertensis]|nr:DHH family phosphoesterase [Anaerosalibacter bizertensis]
YLNKKGIDVIVTDHHQCGEVLPNCVAVINPNREDCSYPFKKLAGVGVAFKLVQGLSEKLGISIDYEQILPIVAVGTVADVMPLVGENRVIVKNGLKIVNNRQRLNIGLEALLEVSGLKNKEISSYHIGFVLGPRLNASGRLGVASTGVEMFVSKNYEKAFTLAKELDEENKKRQEIEDGILKEAEELIKQQVDLEKDK